MDRRRHERFDALIETEVRDARGFGYRATILNLSSGGAAVGVGDWDGEGSPELFIPGAGEWIGCELRHVEPVWQRTILHLEFGAVSRGAGDAVDALLLELKQQRDAARNGGVAA